MNVAGKNMYLKAQFALPNMNDFAVFQQPWHISTATKNWVVPKPYRTDLASWKRD